MTEKQAKTEDMPEFVKRRRPARRAILEVARRLLVRDGAEALTPEAVAKESGLSLEIVYAYFCNRDELLLSIASDELSALNRKANSGEFSLENTNEDMGILELPKIVESFIAARAAQTPEEYETAEDAKDAGGKEDWDNSEQSEEKTVMESTAAKSEQSKAHDDMPKPQPTGLVREVPRARRKPGAGNEIDGLVKELTSNDQPGENSIPASVVRLERRVYVIERDLAEQAETASKEKAEGQTSAPQDLERLVSQVSALEKSLKQLVEEFRTAKSSMSDRLRILEATPPAGPSFSDKVPNSYEPAIALVESPPAEDEEDPRDGNGGGQNKSLEAFLTAAREAAKSAVLNDEASDAEDDESVVARWKKKARGLFQGNGKLDKKTLLTRVVPIPVILLGLAVTTWAAMSAGDNGQTASVETAVTPPGTVIAIATNPAPAPQSAFSKLEALMAAAEAGDTDAQTLLGLNYLNGEGVAANPIEAVRLLQLAAAEGQAVAQYTLATVYGNPNSTMADPIAAKYWFQAAAEQGNRMAMNNLAMYYAQGLGTEQNTAEAAPWFAMAAALGYKVAQFNLAVLYERGDGVPQDFAEAYKWYAIAAAQGDEDARARAETLAGSMDPDVLFELQNDVAFFEPAAMDPQANDTPVFNSQAG